MKPQHEFAIPKIAKGDRDELSRRFSTSACCAAVGSGRWSRPVGRAAGRVGEEVFVSCARCKELGKITASSGVGRKFLGVQHAHEHREDEVLLFVMSF